MKQLAERIIFLFGLLFLTQGCWAEDQPHIENNISTLDKQNTIIGTYETTVNDIPELCEPLEKNFNSFADQPPMVCERKFNPDLGFTIPDWQVIPRDKIDWEVLKERFVIKNRRRFSPENMDKPWQKERAVMEEALDQGKDILFYAKFDIDNNGVDEQVYKVDYQACEELIDPNNPYYSGSGYTSYVVDDEGKLDIEYRRLYSVGTDIFIYKNATYMTHWEGIRSQEKASIYISRTFKPRNRFGYSTKNTCTFDYKLSGEDSD